MDGILSIDGFDTSLAEGLMLLTPFAADAQDEKTQAFVTAYKEAYGDTPNQFAADAYDVVYAIYQAVLAGGLNGDMDASDICDALKDQFTSMTFDGLTGDSMTWDAPALFPRLLRLLSSRTALTLLCNSGTRT